MRGKETGVWVESTRLTEEHLAVWDFDSHRIKKGTTLS
jgi:hypothetical protein